MIVWINGAFGGGKTTLAQELHRRLPDALPFDPEYVGAVMVKWAPPAPSGDFQDIPLWRKMTAQFAIGLAADYSRTLIVPMTVVNSQYRNEIFGLIKDPDSRSLTSSSMSGRGVEAAHQHAGARG